MAITIVNGNVVFTGKDSKQLLAVAKKTGQPWQTVAYNCLALAAEAGHLRIKAEAVDEVASKLRAEGLKYVAKEGARNVKTKTAARRSKVG